MGIASNLEKDGQLLTLRIDQSIDAAALEEVHKELGRLLTGNIRQLLVLRQDADADYEIETGMAFGERFGDLLAGRGVIVAVVRSRGDREDVAIDTVIFNKGVSLAEFDNEKEARDWLKQKEM